MDRREWDLCRVYAQIDLDAIRTNLCMMNEKIENGAGIMAVIKTNGYGHGSLEIAKATEDLPFLEGFAVATAEEALALRAIGIRKKILILGYTFPYCYQDLIKQDICITVFREDCLPALQAASSLCHKKAKIHIKVDTGMGRIGISPDENGLAFVENILSSGEFELDGIFTHFARADESSLEYALEQYKLFSEFIRKIEDKTGYIIPCKHCANSAGILRMPQAHLNMVRAGIILYGLKPSLEMEESMLPFRPAMSLHSHIVYCKNMVPGQKVSYGGTFTVTHPMRVATVPVGYGDGYPRSLSNKGYVLVEGCKAPILGRVCMDQLMIDITNIPEAAEGSKVTLLGTNGDQTITAEELGELSGRFNYELVCDINPRVPRIYILKGQLQTV